MTPSQRSRVLLAIALSAAIGCSSSDDDGGGGTMALSPMAGAGGAAGTSAGAAGVAGVSSGGSGGVPVGGAAGTIGGAAGTIGGTGGAGGAAGAMAGAGGVAGGMGGMTGGDGGAMSGGMGGMMSGGDGGGGGPVDPPACELSEPEEFEPHPDDVGGGGSTFTDSPHFRIYGASGSTAEAALHELEAAYSCFVETLCWRSSGLSINGGDDGPYYKMNVYSVGSLGGAGGQMFSDAGAGQAYLRVVSAYLADPKVTVHEYGHALTYYEKGWIEQTRTGAWWETVANFVADTYMTSPLCEEARNRFDQSEGNTIIDLDKVIGSAHQVIVDGSAGSGNYYQAWPFLTYLTNNPDGYAGLGPTALREMFREHVGNNETPLHVLERVASPTRVQQIVGRYWARMAYVDIGHEQARERFFSERGGISFANLDGAGGGSYRVKSSRQPRYFGANIIPLTGTGAVTAQVTSSDPFTATLAVRASSGAVRYIDLAAGAGEATVAAGEEASLIVVNTPDELYLYDPFNISGDVAAGLDYEVALTGATPAD